MFALSLKPTPPKPATKQRLLDMINTALNGRHGKVHKDGGVAGS